MHVSSASDLLMKDEKSLMNSNAEAFFPYVMTQMG